jgi:hypothetical protein
MVDAIIIVLVIILLFFALKGSLKHFKGESPCCGGGSGNSGKAKTKFLDGIFVKSADFEQLLLGDVGNVFDGGKACIDQSIVSIV